MITAAPLFVPRMPRTGKAFSVRMSNCGTLGWVSDQDGGYRYQATHPETGLPWPAMPRRLPICGTRWPIFAHRPEACLINYYSGGTRMGSHRDADEEDFTAPVVSVSLGDDAVFHVGGAQRGGCQAARDAAGPAMWWCSAERHALPITASTASCRAPRRCWPRAGGST